MVDLLVLCITHSPTCLRHPAVDALRRFRGPDQHGVHLDPVRILDRGAGVAVVPMLPKGRGQHAVDLPAQY